MKPSVLHDSPPITHASGVMLYGTKALAAARTVVGELAASYRSQNVRELRPIEVWLVAHHDLEAEFAAGQIRSDQVRSITWFSVSCQDLSSVGTRR